MLWKLFLYQKCLGFLNNDLGINDLIIAVIYILIMMLIDFTKFTATTRYSTCRWFDCLCHTVANLLIVEHLHGYCWA